MVQPFESLTYPLPPIVERGLSRQPIDEEYLVQEGLDPSSEQTQRILRGIELAAADIANKREPKVLNQALFYLACGINESDKEAVDIIARTYMPGLPNDDGITDTRIIIGSTIGGLSWTPQEAQKQIRLAHEVVVAQFVLAQYILECPISTLDM